MTRRPNALALSLLLACGAALAAPDGPGRASGDPSPPRSGPVPSAETLATIEGLTPAQQDKVRGILRERRDAEDALRARMRAEHEELARKEREERDRIGDRATRSLRDALGEDGYRAWAHWAAHHTGSPGAALPPPAATRSMPTPTPGGRQAPPPPQS